MGAGHHHGEGGHAAGGAGQRRRLAITLGLSLTYMVAEVIGGVLSNSLALLADGVVRPGRRLAGRAARGSARRLLALTRRASGRSWGLLRRVEETVTVAASLGDGRPAAGPVTLWLDSLDEGAQFVDILQVGGWAYSTAGPIVRVEAIARSPGGKFQDFTSDFVPGLDSRDG